MNRGQSIFAQLLDFVPFTRVEHLVWTRKPGDQRVLHEVESIIPENLWNACVTVLDEKRVKGKRTAKNIFYLFT